MNRKDTIFIISPRTGYIPQLSMSGPIVSPLKVEAGLVYDMVAAGVDVHRYCPCSKMTHKLTLDNVYDDHMFDSSCEEEATPQAPIAEDVIPDDLPTNDAGDPIIDEPEGMVPEAVIVEQPEQKPQNYNNNQFQGKKGKGQNRQ